MAFPMGTTFSGLPMVPMVPAFATASTHRGEACAGPASWLEQLLLCLAWARGVYPRSVARALGTNAAGEPRDRRVDIDSGEFDSPSKSLATRCCRDV